MKKIALALLLVSLNANKEKPFGEDFIKSLEEDEDWDEDRIERIGPNGNDGLHYNQDLDLGDDNG